MAVARVGYGFRSAPHDSHSRLTKRTVEHAGTVMYTSLSRQSRTGCYHPSGSSAQGGRTTDTRDKTGGIRLYRRSEDLSVTS